MWHKSSLEAAKNNHKPRSKIIFFSFPAQIDIRLDSGLLCLTQKLVYFADNPAGWERVFNLESHTNIGWRGQKKSSCKAHKFTFVNCLSSNEESFIFRCPSPCVCRWCLLIFSMHVILFIWVDKKIGIIPYTGNIICNFPSTLGRKLKFPTSEYAEMFGAYFLVCACVVRAFRQREHGHICEQTVTKHKV